MKILAQVAVHGVMLACALGLPSFAQTETRNCSDQAPSAQLLACAKSTPDGSPQRILAYANLGTRAFTSGDVRAAAEMYKHTIPPNGQSLIIDVTFHAFRSSAFHSIGLDDIALEDARTSLKMMASGTRDLRGTPLTPTVETQALAALLDTLIALKAPEADAAVARYLAIPSTSWIDSANRGAVLGQVRKYAEALTFIDEALKAQPNHPALKNNKCQMLVKLGRPADAIPYCEAAVATDPKQPAFLDTYSAALSSAGRCPEAVKIRDQAAALFPENPKYRKKPACEAQ